MVTQGGGPPEPRPVIWAGARLALQSPLPRTQINADLPSRVCWRPTSGQLTWPPLAWPERSPGSERTHTPLAWRAHTATGGQRTCYTWPPRSWRADGQGIRRFGTASGGLPLTWGSLG